MEKRRRLMSGGDDRISITVNLSEGVADFTLYIDEKPTVYNSSAKVKVKRGVSVRWTATASEDYTLTKSSENLGEITEDTIISVEATPIPVYEITVLVTEGVIAITVNGQRYTDTTVLRLKEGAHVEWSAELQPGLEGNTSGSFTVTGARTISVAAKTKYYITINVGEGTSSITVNIDGSSQTYYSTTSIEVLEGSYVSWTASFQTGYIGTSSGNFTVTGPATIDTNAYLQSFTLYITLNAGVRSITVNSQTYYYSTSINLDYGTYVEWSAEPEDDYVLNTSYGSFSMTRERTISPTATANQYYNLSIDLNEGVAAITVNGQRHTSSTTLSFKEGTYITWSAELSDSNKYYFNGDSSGSFYLNSNDSISPVVSTYKFKITVNIGTGDSYVEVTINNGSSTKYYSTTSIDCEYGDTFAYQYTYQSGYSGNTSKQQFTVTQAKTISSDAALTENTLRFDISTHSSNGKFAIGVASPSLTDGLYQITTSGPAMTFNYIIYNSSNQVLAQGSSDCYSNGGGVTTDVNWSDADSTKTVISNIKIYPENIQAPVTIDHYVVWYNSYRILHQQ